MAIKSSKDTHDSNAILLFGPRGVGKTFAAATASKLFPHDRVAALRKIQSEKGAGATAQEIEKLDWVDLSDLLWVPFDEGALDGLRAYRISVPCVDVAAIEAANTTDIPKEYNERDTSGGLVNAPKMFAEIARDVETCIRSNPQVETLILDTESVASALMTAWCYGKFSKPQCYDQLRREAAQWYIRTRGLTKVTLRLFHPKAISRPIKLGDSPESAAVFADKLVRMEAEKMDDFGQLTIDCDDRFKTIYQANVSNQWALHHSLRDMGKTDVWELQTRAIEGSKYETKSRTAILLNSKEPANLRPLLLRMGVLK